MFGDGFAFAEGSGYGRAGLDDMEAHFRVKAGVDQTLVFMAPQGDVEEGGEKVFRKVPSFCVAVTKI